MPADPTDDAWQVEVRIGPLSADLADRLAGALLPESSTGVPGSTVEVGHPSPSLVLLRLEARGTSGVRAALNSHLRWVDLALRVDHVARSRSPS